MAFTLVPCGTIHDTFSDTFVSDSRFESLLLSPPLVIAGEHGQGFLATTDE